MPRKTINSLLAALACALPLSCEYRVLYDQYQMVEQSAWGKDKVYYFTFMVTDNSIPYDVTLDIRNSNDYPYQNLWLFCNEEPPAGDMRRDTIECMLADESGKWYGRGISLYECGFPIRENYRFAYAGQYTFSVRQGMRDSLITGIREIGLQVVPTGTR